MQALRLYSDINLSDNEAGETRLFCQGQIVTDKELPPADRAAIAALRDKCLGLNVAVGDEAQLSVEGVTFRVHREAGLTDSVFCLRQIRPFRPALSNGHGMHFPSDLRAALLRAARQQGGGMYIVSGALGSGKTTTAAAFLTELLTAFGGVAWTVEHPPEYIMEGEYRNTEGNLVGVCYQHSAAQGDFASAIRGMMRCFPSGCASTLLIGEIRDQATAREALKAVLSGTRVVFTIHGGSINETLLRMIAWNEDSVHARKIIGETLRLLVHQTKTHLPTGDVHTEFDLLEGGRDVSAVLSNEQNATYPANQITDLVRQQRNRRRAREGAIA